MNFKVLVLVTPVLFSSTGSVGKADCDQIGQKKAYLIRTQLAGVEMNVDQKDFVWFDKTSGYYLAKAGSLFWLHQIEDTAENRTAKVKNLHLSRTIHIFQRSVKIIEYNLSSPDTRA